MELVVSGGKLPGILAYALDEGVNRSAKAPAKSGHLAFLPVLGLDQLRAGSLRKDNRVR